FPQERRQHREALPRHGRMPDVRLVLEPDASATQDGFVRRNAIVGEPLLPPVVAGIDADLLRYIVRLDRTAEVAFDGGDTIRACHRREVGFEELMFLKPLPPAISAANRDIG